MKFEKLPNVSAVYIPVRIMCAFIPRPNVNIVNAAYIEGEPYSPENTL